MFKEGDRVVSKSDTQERDIMVVSEIKNGGGTWPVHCKSEISGAFAGAWPHEGLMYAKPLVKMMSVSAIAAELQSQIDNIKIGRVFDYRTKELLLRLIELNTVS